MVGKVPPACGSRPPAGLVVVVVSPKLMPKYLLLTIFLLGGVWLLTGCGTQPAYLQQSSEGTGGYLENASAADQQVRADISKIRSALLSYAQVNNSFPPSLDNLLPQYLEAVPVSPLTNQPYEYRGDLLGGDYELKYQLSNGQIYTANKNTTDLQWKEDFDKPNL